MYVEQTGQRALVEFEVVLERLFQVDCHAAVERTEDNDKVSNRQLS